MEVDELVDVLVDDEEEELVDKDDDELVEVLVESALNQNQNGTQETSCNRLESRLHQTVLGMLCKLDQK